MYKYFGCIFFFLNQSTDIAAHYIRWLKSLERERDGRKSQVKYQRDQQNIYRNFGSCRVSVVATIRWPTEEECDCYIIYLSRVARVKKECGAFKTDPVAFPAAFPRQLDLVFLPEQPFLDTQEASLPHCPRAVEGGSGTTLFGLNINIIIIMHF